MSSELHAKHIRAHLKRLGEGVASTADPQESFLGAEDADAFYELVALGMVGVRSIVLAALHFPRHGNSRVPYGRESLARYLTSPPLVSQNGKLPVPPGQIEALLPRTNESVSGFLGGLRAGRAVPSVIVDPRSIRFAFDFRGSNPSASPKAKGAAGPLRSVAVRTVDGHVFTGRASRLGAGGDRERFVALAETFQVTPKGAVRLPDLILNTSWIALAADVTEETARLAVEFWAPFRANEANEEIVLGLPAARPRAAAPTPTPPRAAPPTPAPTLKLPESRFPGPEGR